MNRIMKITIIIIACVFCFGTIAQANQDTLQYPEIGKPLPDFMLDNVHYFIKSMAQGEDFRGKWLILDFWSKGCGACIASFPKMNKLQASLKDSMHLVLVGINSGHWGRGIESLYQTLKERHQLDLTVAYDSLLHKQWGIITLPHIVVVDPQGIVRAVTGSVDEDNLQALMQGRKHRLKFKRNNFQYADFEDPVRLHEPFLVSGNVSHDLDFEHRSILSKFDPSIEGMTRAYVMDIDGYFKYDSFIGEDKAYWQGSGLTLIQLYRLAYLGETDVVLLNYKNEASPQYGNFHPTPILETSDADSLAIHLRGDLSRMYNYSLILPKGQASKAALMWHMQCDLMKYFPYEVRVETRQLPVFELRATPAARKRLRTKGKDPKLTESDGYTYVKFVNMPLKNLITNIYSITGQENPVFDMTGIEGNVDLDIDGDLKDFESVKKSLQKSGLDIVLGTKEMKCIVFRDRENDL